MVDDFTSGSSEARKFAAAFSAAVFALFLTNIGLEVRSRNTEWALWALSLSIALLSVWWVFLHSFRDDEWEVSRRWIAAVLASSGYVSGFAGLILTVANVSETAASILIVAPVLGTILLAFAVLAKDKPRD